MDSLRLVAEVVDKMQPIGLDEMDGIKLMNRIDTKYVLPLKRLPKLLHDSKSEYRVMEVAGSRIAGYSTLYYDTPNIDMYRTHQRGKLNRQKVRTRIYLDTSETFLEIKNKTNRGRTKKRRISIPKSQMVDFSQNAQAVEFLAQRAAYRLEELQPTLYTKFKRVTLVDSNKSERITIDIEPSFESVVYGSIAAIQGLVIVEVKHSGNSSSKFSEMLLRESIHPFRVSKYCLGTALTNSSAPRYRMKLKIRRLEKIIKK